MSAQQETRPEIRPEIRNDQRGTQKDDRPHRAQLLWTCTVALAVAATAFFQLGSPRSALLRDSSADVRSPLGDMPGIAQRYNPPSDFAAQLPSPFLPSSALLAPLSAEVISSSEAEAATDQRPVRKARQPSSRD